jgi:hypothetical protein
MLATSVPTIPLFCWCAADEFLLMDMSLLILVTLGNRHPEELDFSKNDQDITSDIHASVFVSYDIWIIYNM